MMNTKTMRKAARDLKVGDIWHTGGERCVVFAIAASMEPGKFLYVHSVVLGNANGIACAQASLDSQLDIELPAGLTPVQAAADKLLGYARSFQVLVGMGYATSESEAELNALLAELDPPKPPTLEEALAALRAMIASNQRSGMSSCAQEAAEALLKRVPD